jgi:ABC-type lipoprotein release transport system permease subunit
VLEAGKYYDNVQKLNEVSDDLSENNECTFSDVDGHTEIDYLTEQQRLDEMAQNLDMWESQKKDRQREKEAKRQLKKKKETRRELAYAAWSK